MDKIWDHFKGPRQYAHHMKGYTKNKNGSLRTYCLEKGRNVIGSMLHAFRKGGKIDDHHKSSLFTQQYSKY